MTPLDAAVWTARWAEAVGATVLFGAPLLLLLARTPAAQARGARGLTGAAGGLLALCAAGALVAQTASMSGALADALAPGVLPGVVAETAFGRSVVARLAAAVVGLLAARRIDRPAERVVAAAAGGAALASLAWSGHGAADAGPAGWLHTGADALHLLAAGAWLGALAALALLAGAPRGRPEATDALAAALDAFSGVGVGVTLVLAATGAVNAAFLAGPPPWPHAADDAWLRWLVLKLGVFALMLALAALNRWRWRPGLASAPGPALGALRRSLALEAVLGLTALAAAAAMGGLAPPASRA